MMQQPTRMRAVPAAQLVAAAAALVLAVALVLAAQARCSTSRLIRLPVRRPMAVAPMPIRRTG